MIPKIIYTTWVSEKPYPEQYKQYLEGWKKLMPDYEIIIIDLENVIKNDFTNKAIKEKRFVLAGHYGRCERLYETGGLYFDIDIEAIKRFDDLLDNKLFFGKEDDVIMNNAVIGCEKGNPFMKACMEYMDKIDTSIPNIEVETGPWMFTKLMETGTFEATIYPLEYFYPYHYTKTFTPECIKENTYAIHHWAKTWG